MHPIKLADRLEGKVWLIKRELSRILSGQVSTLRKIGANTFSTMDSTQYSGLSFTVPNNMSFLNVSARSTSRGSLMKQVNSLTRIRGKERVTISLLWEKNMHMVVKFGFRKNSRIVISQKQVQWVSFTPDNVVMSFTMLILREERDRRRFFFFSLSRYTSNASCNDFSSEK